MRVPSRPSMLASYRAAPLEGSAPDQEAVMQIGIAKRLASLAERAVRWAPHRLVGAEPTTEGRCSRQTDGAGTVPTFTM